MKVSTKSEYGMRAMIYLARESARKTVPAREIAEHWKVPVKYLEQILRVLKDSELVESQIGVFGGYRLSRPASLIRTSDVIRALDGPLAPFGCVSYDHHVACEFEFGCELKVLWARTYGAILGVLDNTTISDLCPMGQSPSKEHTRIPSSSLSR